MHDLRTNLYFYRGKKLSLIAAILVISLFINDTTTAMTRKVEHSYAYAFMLNNIIAHGGDNLDQKFLQQMKDKYTGKDLDLVDMKKLQDDVGVYYSSIGMNSALVNIRLPHIGMDDLHIFIDEPQQKSKNIYPSAPLIASINFTGEVSAEPQGILNLADLYVGKPYTLINMMTLKTQIKKYYKETTEITPLISFPDFDIDTRDVYIDITELTAISKTVVAENALSIAPLIDIIEKEKTAPAIQEKKPLYEISRGIFMHEKAPTGWKEVPKKLKAKIPAKEKPVQTEIKTKIADVSTTAIQDQTDKNTFTNITLQLFNKHGDLVDTPLDRLKGYYMFYGIPMTNFTIRMGEEDLKKLDEKQGK